MKLDLGDVADTPRLPTAQQLLDPDLVNRLLVETHDELADVDRGELSPVSPVLTEADPRHWGLAVVGVNGELHEVGDSRLPFTIQSVSKPFTYALVAGAHGIETLRTRIGVNATGLPFNSAEAVEQGQPGLTNPLVNAGAIATASLARGEGVEERWRWLRNGLSRFAGRDLELDHRALEAERESNYRNRALANLLRSLGTVSGSPLDAVEIYTRACSLQVTAVDLAVMGAVLADGGVHPITRERVVSEEVARATLVVMVVSGMYEASGDWLLDVGMPAKSGIGGGIVTVSPGQGALGTFSPLLDRAGNSVRGGLAAAKLARAMGLDLLASTPYRR